MYLFKKILVCSLLSLTSISLYAQPESYNTRYGNLEIKYGKYRDDNYSNDAIYFDNKKIFDGNNDLIVTREFHIKQDDIFLIADRDEPYGTAFYFIKISDDKKPKVSKGFSLGHILFPVKVEQQKDIITVTGPQTSEYVRYTYYNDELVDKNGEIIN